MSFGFKPQHTRCGGRREGSAKDFRRWPELHQKTHFTRRARLRSSIVASTFTATELQNVNSFTRSKTFRLNLTPRKVRKSQQLWHLNKLDQFIHRNLTTIVQIFLKRCLICQNCLFSKTFCSNLSIFFLHRYICNICDILQLCTATTCTV